MIKKIENRVNEKFEVLNNRDGMGTIEMIFLVAVLLSLAILFGVGMKKFVKARITDLTNDETFDKVDPSDIEGRIYNRKIAIDSKSNMIFTDDKIYIELKQEA